MRPVTEDECARTITLYKAGSSMPKVALAHDRSTGTVFKILHAAGVTIRRARMLTTAERADIVARYRKGEGSGVLARAHGVTLQTAWRIVIAAGVKTRTNAEANPPLPCDGTYFDRINTEPKAYWLGLIAADGCVSPKRTGSFTLSIALVDPDGYLLELLKKDLRTEAQVGRMDARGTRRARSMLVVNNARLTQALVWHGIVPMKTYGFNFPRSVPDHLLRHFIRGYFDGDGCVSPSSGNGGALTFSGHHRFLRVLQRTINAQAFAHLRARGCWAPDIRCASGIGTLRYSGGRPILAARRYFYDGATRFMKRKHDLFSHYSN